MWVAKRLDMPWGLLSRGLWHVSRPPDRAALTERLERLWSPRGDALAALSVRSGFDLLWSALGLPARGEVLFSAVTMSDMPRIAAAHGLQPAPLDVRLDTMAPEVEDAERLLTPRTRAVVIAHLFGGRVDLRPWADFCRQHELLLIEDCAQAFDGPDFTGHEEADVSMFSFGPIKTATALGGAMFRVRSPQLLQRMRELQTGWPVQSSQLYRARLCKYACLKGGAAPWPYAVIHRIRRRRSSHGEGNPLRNFPGVDLLAEIRQQPCTPLLATLYDSLRAFDPRSLRIRALQAERLRTLLERGGVCCPGQAQRPHNHWVFPILTPDPQRTKALLAAHGFDAMIGASMRAVAAPYDRPGARPVMAEAVAEQLIYLPCYAEMPAAELGRMAGVLVGDRSSTVLPMVDALRNVTPDRPERRRARLNSAPA